VVLASGWLTGKVPVPSKSHSTPTIEPVPGGSSTIVENVSGCPTATSARSLPLTLAMTTGCTPLRSAAVGGTCTCPSTT
jgi:hypothetical protein